MITNNCKPECCEKPEPCRPHCPDCGELAQQEYQEYLEQEACKPEKFEPFRPCDFDWAEIYGFQYRSRYFQYRNDPRITQQGPFYKILTKFNTKTPRK